jgi:hypothetical protein
MPFDPDRFLAAQNPILGELDALTIRALGP